MSGTGEPDTKPGPKKVSQRTIIIAVVIAAVVLAAVAVLVFVLGNDDDKAPDTSNFAGASSSAAPASTAPAGASSGPAQPGSGGTPAEIATVQGVAEQVVAAFNAHDPAALKKVSCDQQATELSTPPEAQVELASAPALSGDTATVELRLTIGETSTTIPLPLRKQDGNWCAD